MKKLLTVSQGEHFGARFLRTTSVLLIGLGLGMAFWVSTMPLAQAQQMNPTQMIEANLPQGQTMARAGKNDLLSAVCAAVKKNKGAAPQIARVAIAARKQWASDIVRTVFRCLGTDEDNCALYARILREAIEALPDEASDLTELAVSLAPNCNFGGGTDEGNYGGGQGNQNPPPGSIGGGGAGQGARCQVCHNGKTLTISCNAVPAHLGHGDTEGPCPVTPTQNQ